MAKALVVDDHAIFRKMVSNMIKGNFEVVQAADGALGIEALKTHGAEIKIVLSDVNMPNLDGLAMAEQIRQLEGFAEIPIVFLTSERDASMIERAKSIGADNWLPKPFKKDQLQAVLDKIAI